MTMTVDTTLLEAVRRIAPVIRKHSDEAEQQGRLSRPTVDAMLDTGLLRLLTPRSLGGLEVGPVTFTRVVEEVSGYDSAAGWTLTNPVGWAFLCLRLPDQGAEEILGHDPKVLIAAGGYLPMHAIPVAGGYRLTGQAPLVSNCHDATWFTTHSIVMEGDQPRKRQDGRPEVLRMYLPIEDCQIIETWSVLGMRGTGSDDVAVHDVFVPSHRTFPFIPEFKPGTHFQGPLYRFPLIGIVAGAIPPVVLASARQAVDEVLRLACEKTPFGSGTLLRERASTQAKLAQAEAALRSARALLYESISQAWEAVLAGENISLAQRADLLLAATNATSSAVRAVELAYSVAGISGIYTRTSIERHLRDVEVLKQHAFTSESRYETVGQVYLGLQPDFPLVMF
jgi:alkylation response protein AidB-like acyl-CoA dehydrogenase